MKKLLLLLRFATTFASAQNITRLEYNETENTLVMDQVPYSLFGEPDLLWGDVVRRSDVAPTQSFRPRGVVQDGRTFTVTIDQYGLQPVQYFVNYSKEGESGINLETNPPTVYGVTSEEMIKSINNRAATYTLQFTVPSAGVWRIGYTVHHVDGRTEGGGTDPFTVE